MSHVTATVLLTVAVSGFGQNPYYSKIIPEPGNQTFGTINIVDDTLYVFGNQHGTGVDLYPYLIKASADGTIHYNVDYLGNISTRNAFGFGCTMNNRLYMGSYEIVDTLGGETHGTLTKLTLQGDTVFRIVDTAVYSSYCTSVCELEKGRVTTACSRVENGFFDAYVVQYDTLGNQIWEKNYGIVNGHDQFLSIECTVDGGYVLGGYSQVGGNQQRYVVKLDSLGNLLWQNTAGSPTGADACYVTIISDSLYLVYGAEDNAGAPDTYIQLMDSAGNSLWDTTYVDFGWSLFNDDAVRQAIHVQDGYVFMGGGWKDSALSPSGLLLKTDLTGSYVWHRWYQPRANDAYFTDISQLSDSSLVVAGYVFPDSITNTQDAWLLRLNCLGYDTVPYSHFDLPAIPEITATMDTAWFTNDSRYAEAYLWDFGDGETYFHWSNPADTMSSEPIVGHLYQTHGTYQVTLYAIACNDTTSFTQTVVIAEKPIPDLLVYPNPTEDYFHLQVDVPDGIVHDLTIYAADGRKVYSQKVTRDDLRDLEVHTPGWASGLYVGRITEGETDLKFKVVVQR